MLIIFYVIKVIIAYVIYLSSYIYYCLDNFILFEQFLLILILILHSSTIFFIIAPAVEKNILHLEPQRSFLSATPCTNKLKNCPIVVIIRLLNAIVQIAEKWSLRFLLFSECWLYVTHCHVKLSWMDCTALFVPYSSEFTRLL